MSHHFDTPTAREDPRINVCDFYLFEGSKGNTVMALTVNPDAGLSAPDTFREEALYAFRFDLNGDAKEELAFKVRFGAVEHAAGDGHKHAQHFEVRLSAGVQALKGIEGELIASGVTGAQVRGKTASRRSPALHPIFSPVTPRRFGSFARRWHRRNASPPRPGRTERTSSASGT